VKKAVLTRTADPPNGEVALQISNGMVKLLAETTGRGPTKARTMIGHDHVFVTLADTLTKGERTLVAAGHDEDVLNVRARYQSILRESAVELVEGLLGRRVVGFMSANHIDPDLAVEIFVLDASNGALPRQEADSDPA
jgi:uncharacterized protein YbcI